MDRILLILQILLSCQRIRLRKMPLTRKGVDIQHCRAKNGHELVNRSSQQVGERAFTMRYLPFLTVCICLVATAAFGQATKEFNWIPSGNLDVGNLESENDSNYRSVGEIIRSNLVYADATRPPDHAARRTTAEIFTVNIARFRGGPAQGALIIRRQVDSAAEPVELTITIDGAEYGKWARPKPEGNRRFTDVFYVIPATALIADPNNPRSIKWRITMKITAAQPYDSYRYDFFVTRDWGLMPEDYLGALTTREGDDTAAATYLNGLVKEGDHLWDEAIALYTAAAGKAEDFELARCIRRRIRRCRYFQTASKVVDTREDKHFDTHYALGQYCASNGFWNEALVEFTKAVDANAASGDATYHMADAMEYCRMPVAKYAPLMEQAGWLYDRKDVNEVTAHVPINTYEIPTGPTGRAKAPMNKPTMDASFREWTYSAQMVFGASRGAWKIKTVFEPYTEDEPRWIMHLGWLWGPPNESIPKWGLYDHTVSFAQYGSSHCGGIDCGPAWSGCCQVGPGRGWEVILHEWNHQFDWTAQCAETGPGYATTHDSDGCGKQPIVNMGCGHRSSMRYYLRPAQYRRIEPSDPDIPQTHIRAWALYGPLDAPVIKGTADAEVLAELKKLGLATDKDIPQIRAQANRDNKSVAETAKAWFYASRRMDLVKAVENEAGFGPDVLAGPRNGKVLKWKTFTDPDGGRIDLAGIFPNAAPKSYAYAHTYIWSPEDQEVRVWYGHHDGLRVWHNTRMVHEGRYYNVAYYEDPEWVDMVAGHLLLKKGWNSLLCKIERCGTLGSYGVGSEDAWGFSVVLVNYDNTPVTGLKYQAEVPDGHVNVYKPPQVGTHYRWDDVNEDYFELLPELTEDDFRAITGIPELTLVKNAFLMTVPRSKVQKGSSAIALEDLVKGIGGETFEGEKVTPVNFLDLRIPGTPRDQEPTPFNKFKTGVLDDVTLNNFFNMDREGAGAFRYVEDGQPRDLLFIRPEYLDEYLELIDDKKSGMPGKTKDRILGYWFLRNAAYRTTGNRTWRAVVVAKTYLGETYPTDEQDILAVPPPPPPKK